MLNIGEVMRYPFLFPVKILDPPSTSSPIENQPFKQSKTILSHVPASSNQASRDTDASTIAFLQEQLKPLTQKLKASKGLVCRCLEEQSKKSTRKARLSLEDIREVNEQLRDK
jgi:hypothetical protein